MGCHRHTVTPTVAVAVTLTVVFSGTLVTPKVAVTGTPTWAVTCPQSHQG